MTDLTPSARLCLIGACGFDSTQAEAVARVVIQKHPYRQVAAEYDIPEATLYRTASRVRAGIAEMMRQGKMTLADMVVRE